MKNELPPEKPRPLRESLQRHLAKDLGEHLAHSPRYPFGRLRDTPRCTEEKDPKKGGGVPQNGASGFYCLGGVPENISERSAPGTISLKEEQQIRALLGK